MLLGGAQSGSPSKCGQVRQIKIHDAPLNLNSRKQECAVTGNDDFPWFLSSLRTGFSQETGVSKQQTAKFVSKASTLFVERADRTVGSSPTSVRSLASVLQIGISSSSPSLVFSSFCMAPSSWCVCTSPGLCSGSWLQWVCNRMLMTPLG